MEARNCYASGASTTSTPLGIYSPWSGGQRTVFRSEPPLSPPGSPSRPSLPIPPDRQTDWKRTYYRLFVLYALLVVTYICINLKYIYIPLYIFDLVGWCEGFDLCIWRPGSTANSLLPSWGHWFACKGAMPPSPHCTLGNISRNIILI